MLRELCAVGIGGAAGSIARYLLSHIALAGYTMCGFPIGTFTVNVVGSLLIGILIGTGSDTFLMRLLVVGFCGGFTTFSTFSMETLQLLRSGDYISASLYIGLSLVVCLCCAAIGIWIGQLLKN